MASLSENPTVVLANDVEVLADHLAELLSVIVHDCASSKAATLLDCAERYVVDLKKVCRESVDTARAAHAGGAQ